MAKKTEPQRVYIYFGPYEDAKARLANFVKGVFKAILFLALALVTLLGYAIYLVVSAIAAAAAWFLSVLHYVLAGVAFVVLLSILLERIRSTAPETREVFFQRLLVTVFAAGTFLLLFFGSGIIVGVAPCVQGPGVYHFWDSTVSCGGGGSQTAFFGDLTTLVMFIVSGSVTFVLVPGQRKTRISKAKRFVIEVLWAPTTEVRSSGVAFVVGGSIFILLSAASIR